MCLQKNKEENELVRDLIIDQINFLNSKEKFNFNELLSLLIKSIKIKDEILFKKCLDLFSYQDKLKYDEQLNNYIIPKNDINNYLFNKDQSKSFSNEIYN